VLVEQNGDDFIFLLNFGLKSNDFTVFGILLLGRLAGRLKYQSSVICKLLLRVSWGQSPSMSTFQNGNTAVVLDRLAEPRLTTVFCSLGKEANIARKQLIDSFFVLPGDCTG